MTFWGSTIDPSKAALYSKMGHGDDSDTNQLPSSTTEDASSTVEVVSSTAAESASTTKQYTKPTDHLPDDHAEADGESHKPAFPGSENPDSAGSTKPTISTTPDEGYFSHMSDLLSSQTWLFAGLGVIVALGVGVGIFFWRRRVRLQSRGKYYSTVADDDMHMSSLDPEGESHARLLGRGRGGRTKELYDAFGELSDDEDDDGDEGDEEMGLRGAGAGVSPVTGLRYHDGFLDDDDPNSAAVSPATHYRDEPTAAEETGRVGRAEGSGSPSSGSGSWEHASDETLQR